MIVRSGCQSAVGRKTTHVTTAKKPTSPPTTSTVKVILMTAPPPAWRRGIGGVPASGAVLRCRPKEKCGSVFGTRLASVPMTMIGIMRKLPNIRPPPKIRIAM